MNIIKELEWRGLVKQITNEERLLKAQKDGAAVYCGFDPTADSLHVGHLMMIVTLKRFDQAGFQAIGLIGGGTGMIGDPSFKADERKLQTDEQVKFHANAIQNQLLRIIPDVTFANNADWLGKMSLIDFLRDVGKDFNISYLLNKDSIATRISTGLSVTEFSYTMLQAYDFYNLYIKHNCKVQIGGSDQWGNITSGTDYISTKVGSANTEAAGFTIPLLTKSDGKKFGKTESGAVWLDANKTSVYDFYQFWINQDDNDCVKMLKFLTFLTQEEISELELKHKEAPHLRTMQKTLASEVTKFVHGEAELNKAIKLTEAFFAGNILNLDDDLLELAIKSIPTVDVEKTTLAIEAIVNVNAATSKREAREFINSRAISFNDEVIIDENMLLSEVKTIKDNKIIVKKGKRKYYLLNLK
ncbi:tyrosine--tRNA ligase [Mesoplasma coleopterae]|uniref:Tyrosine--tRNA ligase n=1 Tax=Mesoplasma coleopterae TaxID=324078 RepID=A0A2K8P2Y4_9MOLU|nr:tyrosine--tRNA ligase [Mesoplasma coleopterae]ATZ21124.1 tyrosyl-tRNA synthetase [Mesoplasma coleopterae]AVN63284.1 tyrosine--tRNA ligase [Mesoplasma coleopterae]